MEDTEIYISERIFTGEYWLSDHAVVAEKGIIKELVHVSELRSSHRVINFGNHVLAPAFIDLQIYGAYGKLLAVYPETDSLNKLKQYCETGGAAFCMPTVATNTMETFHKCIGAVREYWNAGGEGILGLHLEGPWINPLKRGAHIASLIHPPSINEVKELLEYGEGIIKIITLAPEVCSKEIIELILSYDIIISAGHSNATYDETKTGFNNGISAVTHLYNAMSPLQHRAPGLVGATMDDRKVMASIIPDGYHVDYAAIRVAKAVMKERLFVITDAVTETNEGNYQHKKVGDKYEAGGILSGSALTMIQAVQNLVSNAGVELSESIRMCSLYPAQVIHMDHKMGKIEKGYISKIIVLDGELNVKQLLS